MSKPSYSLGLIFALVVAFGGSTYAQKRVASPKLAGCGLPSLSFQCPKGLKVLKRDTSNGMFLAQRKEKDYTFSVFVVNKVSTADIEKTIEKDFLPLLFPKSKPGFEWRDLEFLNNKPVSKFEVRKKLLSGFNAEIMVNAVYREIVHGNKSFFVGSVWREDESAEVDRDLFERATGMVEGSGCYHVVRIVRSITGERTSVKNDPCSYELIEAPMSNNL